MRSRLVGGLKMRASTRIRLQTSRTADFGGAAETQPTLFPCLNAEYGRRIIIPERVAAFKAGIGDAVYATRCSEENLVEIHRASSIGVGRIEAQIHTLAVTRIEHRRGDFRPCRSRIDPHRGETLRPIRIAPDLQL